MAWWDVAGLTPLVAFDANPDGISGTTWLDRIGSNDMTFGGVRKDVFPSLGIAGSGNLMPLASPIALPAYFVFAAFFNIKTSAIFGYKAAGDSNSYLMDFEPGQTLYNSNAGTYAGVVYVADIFVKPTFVAIVRNSAGTYAYFNDSAFYTVTPNTIMTDLAGCGYVGPGNSYNPSTDDSISTWGLWSGDASLATVKAMEVAARQAVAMPLPTPRVTGSVIRRSIGTPPAMNTKVVGAKIARRNQFFGGGHTISGVVTIEGVPAQRIVRCHERLSNVVVAEKMSAPNGYYEFTHLDPNRRYYVVAFDYEEVFNMVGKDRIKFR